MKNISAIITLWGLTIIVACKKDEKYWPLGNYWKGTQIYGKVQALRNGQFWEASGMASHFDFSPFCTISINTFDPVDSLASEGVAFVNLPYREGLFRVHHPLLAANNPVWVDSLSSLYVLQYDDLYGPFFHADTTKNNWIQIESIDSVQNIIKGKFDVTYRISPEGEASTNYPREVHFSKGGFEVKVHQ